MAFDPLARDTPRYDLCRIPEGTTKLYGFPVKSSPDAAEPSNTNTKTMGDNDPDDDDDVFHLAYFSNLGPIALRGNDNVKGEPNETVEQAVIVIHGSLRDAEDYFCAGLSLIQDGDNNGTTMILAPKFASVRDNLAETYGSYNDYKFLEWDDYAEANDEFLWHTWRYGSDAANAPISSFAALDQFVQTLVDETYGRFPNLQQITLAGHSGTYTTTIVQIECCLASN